MMVGFIQYDVMKNKKDNFNIVESSLSKEHIDVLVLPELSTTGYLFENKDELYKVSEEIPQGKTLQFMLKLSKNNNNTIIFGMSEIENKNIYNTAVIVSKGKYIGKYQKIHLSNYEKQFFTPGVRNKVFNLEGIKIGVQICFDAWFPEISREQVRQGANLLCVLGNFGGKTTFEITKIRAIENLIPIVLCNRVGGEKLDEIDAYFCGKSSIFDINGKPIVGNKENIFQYGKVKLKLDKINQNIICNNFNHEIEKHYN